VAHCLPLINQLRASEKLLENVRQWIFFTQTAMDAQTLAAHKQYTEALKVLKSHVEKNRSTDEFALADEYWAIRDYLSQHLSAGYASLVGVKGRSYG
jgi:hypothetical protein